MIVLGYVLWGVLGVMIGWAMCNTWHGRLVTKIKETEFKVLNRKARL